MSSTLAKQVTYLAFDQKEQGLIASKLRTRGSCVLQLEQKAIMANWWT